MTEKACQSLGSEQVRESGRLSLINNFANNVTIRYPLFPNEILRDIVAHMQEKYK